MFLTRAQYVKSLEFRVIETCWTDVRCQHYAGYSCFRSGGWTSKSESNPTSNVWVQSLNDVIFNWENVSHRASTHVGHVVTGRRRRHSETVSTSDVIVTHCRRPIRRRSVSSHGCCDGHCYNSGVHERTMRSGVCFCFLFFFSTRPSRVPSLVIRARVWRIKTNIGKPLSDKPPVACTVAGQREKSRYGENATKTAVSIKRRDIETHEFCAVWSISRAGLISEL